MVEVVIYSLTLLLSLCFVTFYFMRRRVVSFRSTVFLCLVINIAATALVAMISNQIEVTTVATGALYVVQYATQMLYFLFHGMLAPLYWLYILAVNRSVLERTRLEFSLLSIPMIVAEILVLLTPFTGFIFTYDANANFVRGKLEIVFYIVAAFYLVLSIREMIVCRETVSRKHIFLLWYFFSFIIAGVVIQALVPEMTIELFFEVIALLGFMFSIEGEDGLIDSSSRAYNRRAFVAENKKLIEMKHKYSVITISILNFKLYKRLLGYQALSEVISNIVEYLNTVAKRAGIYRISPSNIAVVCTNYSEENLEKLISEIENKFNEEFDYLGTKLDFNVNIACVNVPDDFKDSETILHVAEDTIAPDTVGVRVFRNEDFNHVIRYSAIEQALKEAITKNRFMVHFQPVWSVERSRITSAEALVRLTDPRLGFIPPDEFIPIAEKCALISDIGFIVLEKVCQVIASPQVQKMGLDYIAVNLSIHQMSAENFVDRVKEIMDKYGVTSKQIVFEITETASNGLIQSRISKVQELMDAGFEFSLDDYGTGYSNLSFVTNLDFLNIKSDKALLWDSKKNKNSKIILEDSIRMIRKLDCNVIQEGVETKEQYDFVVSSGANYIQGYYFSRPLPIDEFIEYVESKNS